MSWGVATQNGVSVSLASIVSLSCGATEFSPASLFTSGVAGAWYDPSDTSTLFQDSAGTTPVTAVEQPVGLMLDKSQGLSGSGSQLVTNGDFSSPSTTGWQASGGGSFSVVSNRLQVTGAGATGTGAAYTLTTIVGMTYTVSFDVVLGTATVADSQMSLSVAAGASIGSSYQYCNVNGTYKYSFVATATTTYFQFHPRGTGNTASVDNFSVISLGIGNHASQATAASRPVLRARYNLTLQSETLSNAAWSNGNILNGTRSNGSVSVTNSEGYAYIQQTGTYITTVDHTISFDVVCDQTINNVPIRASGVANTYTLVNLVAGQTQRITLTGLRPTATYFEFGIDARNVVVPGGSDATGYVVTFNRIDLRTGSSAGTYQRIAAATDYATAGFLPYLYFVTDDSFGTNSIDFTATDKMSICAGATKSSDASVAILVELSSTTNPGSFYIAAPFSGGAANYAFTSTGSSTASATASGYTAPITNVVTMQSDIAAPSIVGRINGAQVVTNSTTQGTGNYGNYPLYIGRRNNASLPFNGNIYQLIVCGKALSASELASTEAYVNSKTGAY